MESDRVHAHWIRVFVDYNYPVGEEFTDRLAMCSNCNHVDGRYTFSYSKLIHLECPYCKAVMDGEDE